MFQKLFLYTDLFAEPVTLSLQGQTRFRTIWGATLSSFLLVLLVFILWSSLQDYQNGTIKKVLFSEIYESNDQFVYDVQIRGEKTNENFDRDFQVAFIGSNGTQDIELQFNRSQVVDQKGIYYLYTLLPGQKIEIRNNVSFRTTIKLLNQSLVNKKIIFFKKYNSYNSFTVEIKIQSSLINQQNAFETFIQSQTVILTKGLTKIVPIEIRRVKRQEEPEIFQFTPKPTHSFYSSIQSEQVVFNDPLVQSNLLEIQVYLNNIIQCYQIELFGVLDIMSGFGGIYQFIFSFILLILRPLNKIMQRYILITALFDFYDEDNKPKMTSFKKRNAITNISMTSVLKSRGQKKNELDRVRGRRSTAFQNLKTQIQNATEDIQDQPSVIPMLLELKKCQIQEKITAYFKEIQKNFTLSLTKYIKYRFFCCLKRYQNQRQHLSYTENNIRHNIDIYHIIRKLSEIDKLKMLLLSTDQIKLFDYLPKKVVDLNKDFQLVKQQGLLQEEVPNFKSLLDAQQAYQEIFKSEENNIINNRLIKTIDPDIVDLFRISTVKTTYEKANKVNDFHHSQNRDPSEELELQPMEIVQSPSINVQQVRYFTPHSIKTPSPQPTDSLYFYQQDHFIKQEEKNYFSKNGIN